MRLRNYLTEGIEQQLTILDNAIPLIKKTTKPWQKIIKSTGSPVFRGMKGTSVVMRKKVRTERNPKDTSFTEHYIIDKAFEREFGWKARSNSLFVTSSLVAAQGYGFLKLIFPIGPVKYIWSPEISDLYMYVKIQPVRDAWGVDAGPIPDDEMKFYMDNPDQLIKRASEAELKRVITSKYKTKGLPQSYSSSEIMINCSEYWAISVPAIYQHPLYAKDTQGSLGIKRFIQEVILK